MKILNINPIKKINLHLHTNVSDGALTPSALVSRCEEIGLDLMSITDHDTIDAYRLLEHIGTPVRILPGIEISSELEGCDVHILAYGFDLLNEGIISLTDRYLLARRERAAVMLDKLAELGMEIEMDEVVAVSGSRELIVRPHIAQVMVAKGYCHSKHEAFDKYIGNFKPAFSPKPVANVEETIKILRAAGAWSSVAHPGKLDKPEHLDMIIEMGIDGIEVWHPDHSFLQMRDFMAIARQHKLLMTAGSDFHGEQDRHNLMDVVPITEEVLESVTHIWNQYKCRVR